MERKKIDRSKIKIVADSFLVGLFAGIVVSSFRWLIQHGLLIWKRMYQLSVNWPNALFLLVVILLVAGIVGHLIKGHSHIMGSGIPEVELQLSGQLSLKAFPLLWRKYIAGVLMISSGGMLGREGPSIQLGSLVGQWYAEGRHLDEQRWRLMIAAGASAGLSAAFGAPLAGAMFILEEVAHSFSLLLWLSALSSALAADLVSEQVFGLKPVLDVVYTHTLPLQYFWLLIPLGILLGLLGRLYQVVTLNMPRLYSKIPWLPRRYHGGIMLLLIWPLGILWPAVIGGGNDVIKLLGTHRWTLLFLLGVVLVRFIYSAISFGSGVPGGIFLPILALGAAIGALIATLAVSFHLMPNMYIPNLIIVSMAGYFAGISKSPFTAIILITEMVGSIIHLLPLIIVALIAYLMVDWLGGSPIYNALASQIALKNQISTPAAKLDELTITISPASLIAGKEVRGVDWPAGVILTRVHRHNRELVANGDLTLAVGDQLTLLFDSNHRPKINQFKETYL
ncbi:hypothetical protein C5L31_000057 [Secundilactobacillus malefermentans]|uniref:RCK C-terminal domain-containing protein n=1 Tax=Secundilactobacillus malefermentans TaxID=176292 RepID=A0A4R5NJG7_9LACO|nr:ClC family H(+)/Cl(-) exchange transporter [Secundilactobacillus malefermentans]KRM59935.1 chloride channel protein EriC [Secundilactobacillus malefermentans DSM 5705 = KCTC 3548]TDG74410.1 hypothetical protein C5L31_000057 [Secundilactobacillus malefermentans]